jgi:hypothetical protein
MKEKGVKREPLSVSSNTLPFTDISSFGKRKKSHGVKSAEKEGCGMTVMFLTRNPQTKEAYCASAMSW